MASTSRNSGCLGMLLAPFFGNKPSNPEQLPYAKRDDFLSPAEISFFHVLKGILTADQYLLTKVNLADIFFVGQPNINISAYNRINRKHVDFLICEAGTMNPLVALELDDSSHQRADRQKRDAFVDQVFAKAGLALIHIPAARGYNPEQLRQMVEAALQCKESPTTSTTQAAENGNDSSTQNPSNPVDPVSTELPSSTGSQDIAQDTSPSTNKVCPKCGSAMVERTARRGSNVGNTFWGCTAYPKCRYTI